MTLLKKLESHRGGLVRLPTQLYWYDRGGWDGTPGRLCLLLDAVPITADPRQVAARTAAVARVVAPGRVARAHLLIDGQPRWIGVAEGDVELINGAG